MPIVPDDKDWTWVLERACPECGFDPASWTARDVAPRVREDAALWHGVLHAPDVRQRPDDATWSPLEYGAHVRDVQRTAVFRLGLMLDEHDPSFPNWDQDETAVAERYNEQDPAIVTDEIVAAAEQLARVLDAVEDDQWTRTGVRSNGSRFTVETFARYVLHDLEHHVWDVAARPSTAH